eukprot:1041359-Rhodomonas_salina.1
MHVFAPLLRMCAPLLQMKLRVQERQQRARPETGAAERGAENQDLSTLGAGMAFDFAAHVSRVIAEYWTWCIEGVGG